MSSVKTTRPYRSTVAQKVVVALALVALGCGPGIGDVAGTVTYKDKPLPDGTVKIRGRDGIPRDGVIQPGGAFLVKNVPAGPAQVLVTSYDPKMADFTKAVAAVKDSAGRARVAFPAEGIEASFSRIPLRYGDFGKSGLQLNVVRGENTFIIPLK
jgi:hypothetical protein